MTPDKTPWSQRTRNSFLIFFLFVLVSFGGWIGMKYVPPDQDTSPIFRKFYDLNGKIWQSLFAVDKIDHAPPPPAGKKFRTNGDLGLTDPSILTNWRLTIISDGSDRKEMQISIDELRALPKTTSSAEFRCIEGWSELISYGGIRFSDFIKYYHLDSSHNYVGLATPDGEYYVSVDMLSMLHPQTLLAYEINGQPLDEGHGAPLRLIIPVKYGIKSLKRIGKITFSQTRPPDYWAERGYDWYSGL